MSRNGPSEQRELVSEEFHGPFRVLRHRNRETHAEALLNSGMERDAVYAALNSLYQRYLGDGQAVERDAVAEVLDAFDGICSPDSAL